MKAFQQNGQRTYHCPDRMYALGLVMAQEDGVYVINLTNFYPGKE